MELCDRLKYARESLGKSQKEMASLLDVGLKSWQVYEQGASVPGGKVFVALVGLGFNANWLLSGYGQMKLIDEKPVSSNGELESCYIEEKSRIDKTRLSPVKQAAHAYIDAMSDTEAAEIVKIIIERKEHPLSRLSPEGKAEVRAILEARLKAIDEELLHDAELKTTGT